MKFEWDERKNRDNQRKHGFNFADAEDVFRCSMLVYLDTREEYGEDRWVGIGITNGRIVVVAYTEETDRNTIRMISMRKALKYERKKYNKSIKY
ncbi:MAG: BrnT family toxin [Chloroflexota bacterium]